MKVKELLKHIPAYQYIRIVEREKILTGGYTKTPEIQQLGHKTLGLLYIKNGVIEITCYDR